MKWQRVVVSVLVLGFARLVMAQESRVEVEPGLLWRWQLVESQMSGNIIKPQAGTVSLQMVGPVQRGGLSPKALRLDGNSKAKHRVVVRTHEADKNAPAENTPEEIAFAELLGKANEAQKKAVLAQIPKRELTVETWAKVEKTLEWGGLAGLIQDNGSYERGWLLGFRKSQFSFALAGKNTGRLTYLLARRQFAEGYWYHVVGTYDGKHQRIYVDGELVGQSTAQQGDINYPSQGDFVIGAYQDKDELFATQGEIERVSVWNRALTATEIAERFKKRSSAFPDILAVRPDVTDWPTYNRDNQRTGISSEELAMPLTLAWEHRQQYLPQPAWPAPAKQDFWHKKFNLQPRVTYDRASHVVSVGNRVFFGSSADDAVHCLDAKTGELVWKFFTEAPVRLAPTVAGSKIVFGSDDGYIYCLNTKDCSLIWKVRLGPSDRKIPGNRRMISAWPVRSSVLVDEGIAYFCAGLFPKQGVYQAAVSMETGKVLASGPIPKSAQGYLERRDGRLFTPTGRDPAGAFVSELKRRGKDIGQEIKTIPREYPYAFVGAGKIRFGGGEGKVAAFEQETGKKIWEAQVAGKAWSLAIAGGRLFVSTDAGHIYSFGPETDEPLIHNPPELAVIPGSLQVSQEIRTLLKTADCQRGYALITESNSPRKILELAQQSQLQILVLASNHETANALKKRFQETGYAGRIAVHHHQPGTPLPYTDYVFNLIITEDDSEAVSLKELRRVQRPNGGALVWGWDAKRVLKRGALKEVGEWSHMYANPANTTCSEDQHVGGELQLQWFGPPGPRQMLDRHLRTVAPLWKNGRMFIPGDNRVIAVDAYNGTPLWNVEVPDSRRVGAYRDCSYIVAGEDSIYVAAKNSCLRLDAKTGRVLSKMQVPNLLEPLGKSTSHQPAVAEKTAEWGYLATVGDSLIGTASAPHAARRGSSLIAINEGTFWDAKPLVTSEGVFTLDRKTGKTNWAYPASGAVINSTIMVADGQVIFVESHNPETLAGRPGRVKPTDLFHYGASVVALDLKTGKENWRMPRNLHSIQHNIFGCASLGKVVIAGSRNNGNDRKNSRVYYDVHVFDSKTGTPVWMKSQNQNTKINGDHGEQDHHPVIVGEKLYCEPHAYNLHTGEPLSDWAWNPKHRKGCGTISASARTFFFRESNPTLFDLATNRYDKVTTSTRPGCWINMIPAGGLLLILEASSGCTCNYAIQTSLAFLPKKPTPENPKGEESKGEESNPQPLSEGQQ